MRQLITDRLLVSLPMLALAAHCATAYSQASIGIENNKPESPVLNLPYTADYQMTGVQHLADGTTIERRIVGHAARSSAGVERLEGTVVPAPESTSVPSTQIWILDRNKHTAVLLNTRLKLATLTHIPPDATATVSFMPVQSPPPRLPAPKDATNVDLGTRTQDGFSLAGHRFTGTVSTGTVGNEAPFQIVTETWFAPQLNLLVSRAVRNPMMGETHMDLTNLKGGDPEPALFEIPPGYRLVEHPAMPQ